MPCSDCTKTAPIPECTDELIVGDFGSSFVEIYIYVRDLATGRVEVQERQTDLNNKILMNLSEPSKDFYKSGKDYEIWVSNTFTYDLDKQNSLEFSVGNVIAKVRCVILNFSKVYQNGSLVVEPKATLQRV